MTDNYPISCLAKRLFDIVFFIIAVSCLVGALIIGFYAEHSEQKIVIGLGISATLIGVLLDYRQKNVYENDYLELAILSDSFQEKYLNSVAKLRHKLVSANVLITVVGILVSGYGVVWAIQ